MAHIAQTRILLCSLFMLAHLPAPQVLPLEAHVHLHMLRLCDTLLHFYYYTSMFMLLLLQRVCCAVCNR